MVRNLLHEGSTHRLICSFPTQHSETKAGLLVPFNKHVQFLGVGSCRYERTVLRGQESLYAIIHNWYTIQSVSAISHHR